MTGTEAEIKAMEREAKAAKATEAWYSGQTYYDYSSAKPFAQGDEDKDEQYAQFANVVWESTTKAGFGHGGEWVAALYCQSKATPFDQVANEDNIGKQCRTQGINQCLNDELRAMHNQKRLLHESPPLEFDEGLAKKLQSALDIASATYAESTVLDLGSEYGEKHCGRNV